MAKGLRQLLTYIQATSRTKRGLLRLLVVGGFVWLLLPFVMRSVMEKEETSNQVALKKIEITKEVTTVNTSSTVVEHLVDVNKVMKERQDVMRNACQKHGLDMKGEDALHQPKPWEFLINKDHHLVWCNVFKSASSSWMYNFNILAGYSPYFLKSSKKVPLTLAREKYPRPSVDELLEEMNRSDSVSFLISRHPLERLISGYRDKIVKALRGSYHDKMRRKIVKKYRPVKLVPHYPKHRIASSSIPTFKEFVEFVKDEMEEGKELDMHWAPVYSFCNPCQVNFKVIASFETLQRDLEFVIDSAKIGHLIKAEKRNEAKGGWKSSEMVSAYLKDLGEPLYNKVVEIYRIDLEIFGYQIRKYQDL